MKTPSLTTLTLSKQLDIRDIRLSAMVSTFRSISVMPSFHHSVTVLPFRSYRCRCARKRNCWKRLPVYV